MHFHIMTLFPEMFDVMHTSVIGRALERGLIAMDTYQIRDFSDDEKHHKVDDYTYGGGAGMLMRAQPVYDCYRHVLSKASGTDGEPPASTADDSASRNGAHDAQYSAAASRDVMDSGERLVRHGAETTGSGECLAKSERDGIMQHADRRHNTTLRTIYLTPQGKVFSQQTARELAQAEHIILLCGHYEGVDERVLEEIDAERISIGDYVLSGGELPAMVLMDAVARLVPGVLSNEESAQTESFDDGLLEYPQYTRPEIWRERRVPEILLSGDHAKVDAWRREQSLERTRTMRPDLLDRISGI
ncbi:MAG: tRNA (guanosine(37)-N1)-methyltransferase TrmD [Lachnospiraceae bacterium]|nr:tRNA (guanosine(37)-N1)-methyltransferase TrmD [Lachnospiraceae bacterium]